MKIILLLSLGICSVILTDSRLIEKVTDRTLTTETTTGTNSPVRLARQIYPDYGRVGLFNENEESQEFFPNFNRKARHFYAGSPNAESPTLSRQRRDSNENVERTEKVTTTSSSTTPSNYGRAKSKPVLVKKPIPKYNELDYDDDFQMKMNRYPVKLLDSGEHEDEDFNVDDYDFDVNHDEFSGRGKPLEPRTKHKEILEKPKPEPKISVAPEIKTQSKVIIPHQAPSIKKERSAERHRKLNEKEDYYDDTSSTTRVPQKARELEDEFNEDNEESKEFDSKTSHNVRMVRSPWRVSALAEKFGDKVSADVSKYLSILPMFPQVPYDGDDFEYKVAKRHNHDHDHDGWSNKG